MRESSWISVNDRLPDVDQKCLIFAKGLQYVAKRVAYDVFSFRSCTNGDPVEPSHWMPLPEPPPKPDAFEEYWATHHGDTGWAKGHARMIWDAAVAATRKE